MADSHIHNVQIFGSEYRIATDADSERTRQAARIVDRKMREVASANSLRSVAQISVLTAVNLADELFRAEASGREMGAAVSRQVDLLAHSLDRP
jgi:cell division protein ZapA